MRQRAATRSERERPGQPEPWSRHVRERKHEEGPIERFFLRERLAEALPLFVILAMAAGSLACSKIPPGRSAVDSVQILNAKDIKASEIEDKLSTQATTRFLFLFQGVAYDYSVYDETVLQRDMARVERFYRSKGFLDAHARVARVEQVSHDHVRVEIVVDEGPPTKNRGVRFVGLEGLPKDVVDAAEQAARVTLVAGERFDEKAFKDSEGAVKRELTDRGYAWAKVDSQAELDVGSHTADYGFSVVPGPRAVFGPITITGLDPDGDRTAKAGDQRGTHPPHDRHQGGVPVLHRRD